MADVRPFAAIRPAKDKTAQIAALPYDVYSREEARDYARRHAGCFLEIDRPETFFPPDYDMYAPEVYERAHTELWKRVETGDFVKDERPSYYLYEQTFRGRTQTGIVALASVNDYLNGVVKKHENTRPEKEDDRVRHIFACQAQTGPIFLCYRKRDDLASIVADVKRNDPFVAFEGPDGAFNRIWIADDPAVMERITKAFADTPALYIADGHHRCASAVRVGQTGKTAEEMGASYAEDWISPDEASRFLCVLFADDELEIMDYNRVVKDLNGMEKDDFLKALEKTFEVWKIEKENGALPQDERAYKPEKKGEFAMYLDGDWYALTIFSEYRNDDPVEGLDASLLQRHVLSPLLGIGDPRTDKRIDFVGGIRGLKELERRCNEDCRVAFALYPTSIAELFAVADAGRLMPPKSTWFEPKLLSGLFIHALTS